MKEFYIRDAAQQENKVVTTSYVVSNKQIKSKKSGEPYLDLTLMDRTGTIQAKMWDNVEECAYAFDQDAVSGDEDDHEDELRGDEGDRGFDPATSPRDGDVRERAGECDRSEYCGDDD